MLIPKQVKAIYIMPTLQNNADFAEKVALEINKCTSLFIELGAIADYLKEKFEKYNAKV
ncbi:hypothetical protein [Calothrix sp. PCC 6303]|uniref:hypothetical protein n=1 Tax=Calothrix sp. PCC 6303 TaxID=1170562 RepID=UPI00130D868A|nr:hypothetical protein [Calothrix sp. PCC 6303]